MTAPLLSALLQVNSDINYYTNEQISAEHKLEAAEARSNKYVKKEEAWCDVYDDVMETEEGKTKKIGGIEYRGGNEEDAIKAADRKVGKLDYEAMEEAYDISVNYDTLKTFYETELTNLNAQKQALTTQLQTAAADTGMLNAG